VEEIVTKDRHKQISKVGIATTSVGHKCLVSLTADFLFML